MQELDDFEQHCKQYPSPVVIARNLRVDSLDIRGEVSSRFAHTNIILTYESNRCSREEQWHIFHYNLKAIAFLYGRDDICADVVQRIERMVWRHCGDLHSILLRCTQRLLHFVVPKLAEKMLAPDYVWRTGTNAGHTTISILARRWNHRMLTMY
jgi:hypothetical protein